MTPFGSDRARRSGEPADGPAADQPERQFEFRDRRRIDPETGALRNPDPLGPASDPADPAGAAQPMTATLTAAYEELAAARQEATERTADLQRVTAEYANYRKRVDRDKQFAAGAAKAGVFAELLGVLDDLDRAAAHGDLTGGFRTVADKLTGTLRRLGLAPYGAVGDEFDPNVHEAAQFATSAEVAHPTVTMVLRLGYTFDDRVLRPAVVGVTGPEHEPAEPAGEGGSGSAGSAGPDGPDGDAVADPGRSDGDAVADPGRSDGDAGAGSGAGRGPDSASPAGDDGDGAARNRDDLPGAAAGRSG